MCGRGVRVKATSVNNPVSNLKGINRDVGGEQGARVKLHCVFSVTSKRKGVEKKREQALIDSVNFSEALGIDMKVEFQEVLVVRGEKG